MSKSEDYIKWLYKKFKIQNYFESKTAKLTKWQVYDGQIYTCYLGVNIGHEKSRIEARPCIIVSNNRINSQSSNVIVVPLSKNIKYDVNGGLKYPHHYVLKKKNYPKLTYDSVAQCEDVRSISKARISTYICNLNSYDIKEIRKRIKSIFQI